MSDLHRVTRRLAGRTVTASCAPGQEPLAADLLTVLERIGDHSGLSAGLRIRFGWSVLTLREESDGALTVCEPDVGGDPLTEIRPRIDTTLAVLAEQTRVARRVGITPVDVGIEQFVIVAHGALGSSALRLVRSAPDGEDSGWTLTADGLPLSENEDDYDATRVYMFLQLRRIVLSVLILPPGFTVVIRGDEIGGIFDESGRDHLGDETL